MNKSDPKALGYANSIVAMLEAEINDTASYRLAIDSIFCHVFGHVTKSGQRALSKYNKTAPASESAISTPTAKRIVEHVVPITVIFEKMKELNEPTGSDLINIISNLYNIRIVTVSEDARLNGMGLKSSMPKEFYDSKHPLFGDWEARHKVAGIN